MIFVVLVIWSQFSMLMGRGDCMQEKRRRLVFPFVIVMRVIGVSCIFNVLNGATSSECQIKV